MASRNICLYAFMTVCLLQSGYAQEDIPDLEDLWSEDRLDEIREMLPELVRKYPAEPGVLYFQGLFAQEGTYAFNLYTRVFEKKENNLFIDDALLRIAQFYYIKGKYSQARTYYAWLCQRYPHSNLVDDARYLICQSLIAEERFDSAKDSLEQFIKSSPRSPYVDLAIMDLESIEGWKKQSLTATGQKEVVERKPEPELLYSIQIGAFRIHNNAKIILNKLSSSGYSGVIIRKKVDDKIFYAVWIGQFATHEAAQDYAKRFVVVFAKNYRIVRRDK